MPKRCSISTKLRSFSILLLICFTASQKLDAAVYSYEFFYGQNVQGDTIRSSFASSLSESGCFIGQFYNGVYPVDTNFNFPQFYTGIYHPGSEVKILAGPSSLFDYTHMYKINNAGTAIWRQYDYNPESLNTYIYRDGTTSLLDLNMGSDRGAFADLNNYHQILGYSMSRVGEDVAISNYFIYENDQFTVLPIEGTYDLNPIALSDNGLVLFEAVENGSVNRGAVHRIGTTEIHYLQELYDGVYDYRSQYLGLTKNGRIYSTRTYSDQDYNIVYEGFAFYNEDGTIQQLIPIEQGITHVTPNGNGQLVAINSDRRIVSWTGTHWAPVTNLDLPEEYLFSSLIGYNMKGQIAGMVYSPDENSPFEFNTIAFYATPVPEPASAVVLGSLLVGLGLRTYRTSRASRKTIGT